MRDFTPAMTLGKTGSRTSIKNGGAHGAPPTDNALKFKYSFGELKLKPNRGWARAQFDSK